VCRILFGVGNGEKLKPFLDAFVKASANDPYKERRGRGNQHRDGWGYFLFRGKSTEHYRSMKPVFEDTEAVGGLMERLNGFTVLMAHSRAASQGNVSLFNTQPLAFSSARGFTFWLIHNGDLDKSRLLGLAEVAPGGLEGASDSYTFGTYLCRRLPSLSLADLLFHYRTVEETMKSIFNTAAVFITGDDSMKAFVTARMRDDYLNDPPQFDYARLISLREDDLFVVASSTLELYHRADYSVVPNERAFYVTIDGEGFHVQEVHL